MAVVRQKSKPQTPKLQPLCPKCGSKNQTRIMYGYPSQKAMEAAEKGVLVLGGCCIDSDSPEWHCRDCGEQWGKLPVP